MFRKTNHEISNGMMPRMTTAPEPSVRERSYTDQSNDPVKAPSLFESMKPSADFCLPQIPGLFRPATTNNTAGIPLPSCWGARGSPWSLRCLTIGGPAKPPELSASRPITMERPTRKTSVVQGRLPRLGKQRRKRKENKNACMSHDTSTKSFASAMSICTSEGWRYPTNLNTQSRRELEPICAVLREELTSCRSAKDVGKVAKMAEKVVSEGNASHFSVGGRLAYRLREASRAICNGSTFAALENHHLLAFRKVLKCEVRRREAEIAGWGEKDAQELALIPEMQESDVQCPPPSRSLPTEHNLVNVHHASIDAGMDTRRSSLAFDDSSKQAFFAVETRPPTSSPLPGGLEEMMQKKLEDTRKQETPSDNGVIAVTDEKKWIKVYGALRDNVSGIHHDDISEALLKIGFIKPDQKWIDEVFSTITKYINLHEDEFLTFVRRYAERQHKAYEQAFHECDADGSGTVEVEELVALLERFGVEPMKHVLDEVLTEVDDDLTGSLNLKEFIKLIESLRSREGFTKSEYDEFVGLFNKFDRDGSGEMNLLEIASVISWLGYAYDADKVQTISQDLDVDGSGLLNFSEFLTLMRQMRDNELKIVRDQIAASDISRSRNIGFDEFRSLFAMLGYLTEKDALLEAAADVGVDLTSDTEFDLGDVWKTLVVWRKREGFTLSETEDIEKAFDRYNKQGSGEINVLEIGKVLRWLGYTPSFEVQQSLVSRVDVDNSGKLSLHEFRKLVRMLQARESEHVLDAFRNHDSTHKGVLHKEFAALALADAGCIDAKGKAPEIPPEDLVYLDTDLTDQIGAGETPSIRLQQLKPEYVPMDVFLRVANEFNRNARQAFQDNSGFSSQEVVKMKECFARYDEDSSGDISSKELICLIEDLFPTMAHDPTMRPKLTKLMREIDADGNGSLDFPDFVRLMQQLQELTMQERLSKEHQATRDTGFSAKEVEEFRELFLAGGDGPQGTILAFGCLQRMLGTICPLGHANLRELTAIVKAIAAKPGAEVVETPSIDFPEFLRLMKKLLEVDFAGIQKRIGLGLGEKSA